MEIDWGAYGFGFAVLVFLGRLVWHAGRLEKDVHELKVEVKGTDKQESLRTIQESQGKQLKSQGLAISHITETLEDHTKRLKRGSDTMEMLTESVKQNNSLTNDHSESCDADRAELDRRLKLIESGELEYLKAKVESRKK